MMHGDARAEAEAWFRRGVVLSNRSQGAEHASVEGAMASFYRAATLRPTAMPAAYNLAAILSRTDAPRVQEAVQWLRHAVRLAPSQTPVVVELAAAEERAGDALHACESYAAALKLAPADASLYVQRGVLLERRLGGAGALEEAARMFAAATSLTPGAGAVWYNAAVVAEKSARGEEAMRSYARAARLAPARADAQHRLGLALTRVGREDEAFAAHRAAIQLAAAAGGSGEAAAALDPAAPALAAIEVARLALVPAASLKRSVRTSEADLMLRAAGIVGFHLGRTAPQQRCSCACCGSAAACC